MAFYPKYKKRVYKKRATAKPKATKVAKAVVQNAIVKYTNKHNVLTDEYVY